MKKIAFLLFAILLFHTGYAQNYYGDVNHDGVVNEADVAILSVLILNDITPEEIDPAQMQPTFVDIQSITLDIDKRIGMKIGERLTMHATVSPANATFRDLVWKSSEPTVVSVTANGEIVALAAGQAEVIISQAINPEKKATCQIIVSDPNASNSGAIDESLGSGSNYEWGN